jgi:hypothetical protein
MTLLEIDPSVVNAGWLPLLLVALVGIALTVIYFSMRHHLRIANTFPTEADVRAERRAADTAGPVDSSE